MVFDYKSKRNVYPCLVGCEGCGGAKGGGRKNQVPDAEFHGVVLWETRYPRTIASSVKLPSSSRPIFLDERVLNAKRLQFLN
jgi:hypothetical protein